jgi:hypothetical protein
MAFFLVPLPHHYAQHEPFSVRTLLLSPDFCYALACPFVCLWWFKSFLPNRNLSSRDLQLAFFIFGIYISSAIRATAVVGFQLSLVVAR